MSDDLMQNLQAGGTLRTDAIYIQRAADNELCEALLKSEFCYVLAPRQIGKSSLSVRTAQHLRAHNIHCATVDLTGSSSFSEDWFFDLMDTIASELSLHINVAQFWEDHSQNTPVKRWILFLQEILLPLIPDPIVIFIDEIDRIRSHQTTKGFTSDDFFGSIRYIYNARAHTPEFSRLSFCLIGVAMPGELIEDQTKTPFNIGRNIRLEDFSFEQIKPFQAGLRATSGDVDKLLNAIWDWTHGHPYMTQRLCDALQRSGAYSNAPEKLRVERLVHELFLERGRVEEANLSFADRHFEGKAASEQTAAMLLLYRRVLAGEKIPSDGSNPIQMKLRLTGMVAERRENNEVLLRIRNPIFAYVFDAQWIAQREAEYKFQVVPWTTQPMRPTAQPRGTPLSESAFIRHTFAIHSGYLCRISWSRDGRKIAAGASDHTARVWDARTGELICTIEGHREQVIDVTWSPDGQTITTASEDGTIRHWDIATGASLWTCRPLAWVRCLKLSPNGETFAAGFLAWMIQLLSSENGKAHYFLYGHSGPVYSVAWSPNGSLLASGSMDNTVRLWDGRTGTQTATFVGHFSDVYSVAWSPDGRLLASSSADRTIRLWSVATGALQVVLEGHTDAVTSVDFSADGRLLASKSVDGSIRIWDCINWNTRNLLQDKPSRRIYSSIAFSPTEQLLAISGYEDRVLRIWEEKIGVKMESRQDEATVYYTNAKVALVGDTGVGKTGLSLALLGEEYTPTDSTHGRHIHTLKNEEEKINGSLVIRETLLWDLAGQPGYRLIHQLNLSEVALALIVFDARSETDPFAGVAYWNRALHQAQQIRGASAPPLSKFLVAARTDRGGIGVSQSRIDSLMRDMNFDGYFETSAKENWGISELSNAIHEAIVWDNIPKVSSTTNLHHIKAFLITEQQKQNKSMLCRVDDLYNAYIDFSHHLHDTKELRLHFDTGLELVEARGIIRRLGSNNLVLLRPELIDAYAAAIVNHAKNEPDGFGCIAENDVLSGNFRMSAEERIGDSYQEQLILRTTVSDLLRHEIALRDDEGTNLVFPAQLTRERPELDTSYIRTIRFYFKGSVQNIYATLVVRLAHSGVFALSEMWKNSAIYSMVTPPSLLKPTDFKNPEELAARIRKSGDPLSHFLRINVFSPFLPFRREEIKDSVWIAKQFLAGNTPFQKYLSKQLTLRSRQTLRKTIVADPSSMELATLLVSLLNNLMQDLNLYHSTRFPFSILSQQTVALLLQNPTPEEKIRLNRWLLEDTLGSALDSNHMLRSLNSLGIDGKTSDEALRAFTHSFNRIITNRSQPLYSEPRFRNTTLSSHIRKYMAQNLDIITDLMKPDTSSKPDPYETERIRFHRWLLEDAYPELIEREQVNAVCGITLDEVEEGQGELNLFFDSSISMRTRTQFEDYIQVHLQRNAVLGSVLRHTIFVCTRCNMEVNKAIVDRRRSFGYDWITCQVCENRIAIIDNAEPIGSDRQLSIQEIDIAAEAIRDRLLKDISQNR